jgi:hypothetical protein
MESLFKDVLTFLEKHSLTECKAHIDTYLPDKNITIFLDECTIHFFIHLDGRRSAEFYGVDHCGFVTTLYQLGFQVFLDDEDDDDEE